MGHCIADQHHPNRSAVLRHRRYVLLLLLLLMLQQLKLLLTSKKHFWVTVSPISTIPIVQLFFDTKDTLLLLLLLWLLSLSIQAFWTVLNRRLATFQSFNCPST